MSFLWSNSFCRNRRARDIVRDRWREKCRKITLKLTIKSERILHPTLSSFIHFLSFSLNRSAYKMINWMSSTSIAIKFILYWALRPKMKIHKLRGKICQILMKNYTKKKPEQNCIVMSSDESLLFNNFIFMHLLMSDVEFRSPSFYDHKEMFRMKKKLLQLKT